jgi:septum formation protein
MTIVLGSASARRKELLELLGYVFLVHPVDVDEQLNSYRNAEDFAHQVALKKGLATMVFHPEDLVICADTIVVLEDKILGKPEDLPAARKMIGSLIRKDTPCYYGRLFELSRLSKGIYRKNASSNRSDECS